MGNPYRPDILRNAVMDAYDDHESWETVLRGIFSPALNPSGFRHNKNADSFFPFGSLGIELTTFLEQPVLLIRPANEILRFYQQLSCESRVRE